VVRSGRAGFSLGAVAALLWSGNLGRLLLLRDGGVDVLVVHFHMVFGAALGLLLVLFLSGRLPELAVFSRRETIFLVLAGTGGYGFWVLRGAALGATGGFGLMPLVYASPLAVGVLSLMTREKAGGRAAVGLLLGFVGCIALAHGQVGGAAGASGGSRLAALGAAACWALFTVVARPVMREEKALPVAVLVMSIGAACLLVTCLSRGAGLFDMRLSELASAALSGFITVGLMTVLWLKCLGHLPAARAAPLWYLGMLFGTILAWRSGTPVNRWWGLVGGVLVLVGLWRAAGEGPSREAMTFGDIIRG